MDYNGNKINELGLLYYDFENSPFEAVKERRPWKVKVEGAVLSPTFSLEAQP